MELKYKHAESTVKPSVLEVKPNTVYLRKDISSITRAIDQGVNKIYWTYKEAKLSVKEFNEYTNLLIAENAIKGTNDSDNIIRLIDGQETGDSNQLTIMEAIADLYEMISTIQGGN